MRQDRKVEARRQGRSRGRGLEPLQSGASLRHDADDDSHPASSVAVSEAISAVRMDYVEWQRLAGKGPQCAAGQLVSRPVPAPL